MKLSPARLLNRINNMTEITDYTAVDISKIAVIDNNQVIRTITKAAFALELGMATKTEVSQQISYLNEFISSVAGIDSKIIGYLYGGYKDSVAIDKIQKLDTSTNVSIEMLTTGNKVAYCPGITTKNKGYFEHDNNRTTSTWYWREFIFASETLGGNIASTLPTRMQAVAYNMGGDGKKAVVSSGLSQGGVAAFTPLSHTAGWWIFSETTTTFTGLSLDTSKAETTRQALNNPTMGIFSNNTDTTVTMRLFNFSTNTLASSLTHTRSAMPVGLSKDKTKGYWVDSTVTQRVVYDPTTVLSVTAISYPFFVAFSESHTVQNFRDGYLMAGYSDNLAVPEYGGTQHGYAAAMSWATETAIRIANLVHPQSSGQIVQR